MKIIGIVAALVVIAIVGGFVFLEISGVSVEQTQITKEIPVAGAQS